MTPTPHITVTGANGFVGRAFCELLQQRNISHTAICRPGSHNQPNHSMELDFHNLATDLQSVLQPGGVLVHLIAKTHDTHSNGSLADYRQVNVSLSRNLAQAAIACGAARIVFLSSVKVNGESSGSSPFTRLDTPNPTTPYGITKLEAEQTLRELCQNTPTRLVILRAPLVYAPHAKGNIAALRTLIRKGCPLPLDGLNNRRSIVDLDALCQQLFICATQIEPEDRIFMCQPETLSTPQLIRRLAHDTETKARLFNFPPKICEIIATVTGKRQQWEKLAGNLEISAPEWDQITYRENRAP